MVNLFRRSSSTRAAHGHFQSQYPTNRIPEEEEEEEEGDEKLQLQLQLQEQQATRKASTMSTAFTTPLRKLVSSTTSPSSPFRKAASKANLGTNALYRAIASEKWSTVTFICSNPKKHYKAQAWHTAPGFFDAHRSACVLPLHQACVLHPTKLALLHLIQAFPGALRAKETGYGRLPLHIACHSSASTENIKTLLVHYPDGAGEKDVVGRVPLHYAVSNGASLHIVNLLLRAGANLVDPMGRYAGPASAVDYNGWLPLHVACRVGASVEIVSRLIDAFPQGASQPTLKGSTPLMLLEAISLPGERKGALEQVLRKAVGERTKSKMERKVEAGAVRAARAAAEGRLYADDGNGSIHTADASVSLVLKKSHGCFGFGKSSSARAASAREGGKGRAGIGIGIGIHGKEDEGETSSLSSLDDTTVATVRTGRTSRRSVRSRLSSYGDNNDTTPDPTPTPAPAPTTTPFHLLEEQVHQPLQHDFSQVHLHPSLPQSAADIPEQTLSSSSPLLAATTTNALEMDGQHIKTPSQEMETGSIPVPLVSATATPSPLVTRHNSLNHIPTTNAGQDTDMLVVKQPQQLQPQQHHHHQSQQQHHHQSQPQPQQQTKINPDITSTSPQKNQPNTTVTTTTNITTTKPSPSLSRPPLDRSISNPNYTHSTLNTAATPPTQNTTRRSINSDGSDNGISTDQILNLATPRPNLYRSSSVGDITSPSQNQHQYQYPQFTEETLSPTALMMEDAVPGSRGGSSARKRSSLFLTRTGSRLLRKSGRNPGNTNGRSGNNDGTTSSLGSGAREVQFQSINSTAVFC